MQSEAGDKKASGTVHPLVFGELTEKNVGQLRLLNTVVFPVNYNDTFYRDLLIDPTLTRLALYNDVLVGGLCCRVENKPAGAGRRLYIMTLGVLAPYRKLNIGTLCCPIFVNLSVILPWLALGWAMKVCGCCNCCRSDNKSRY
jgi:hypothetical protein